MKYIIFLFLTLNNCHLFAQTTYIMPQGMSDNDFRYDYPYALLSLALSKTNEDYGQASIQKISISMNVSREIEELQNKKLDVISSSFSNALAARFTPVTFPISKGTLGIRLPLVTQASSHKLVNIHTLADLQTLAIGQGHDWLDTKIMQANKLNVVTSADYYSLFDMLTHDRFDLFPRGLYEPWKELASRKQSHPTLMVNPDIALHYIMADMFFTHKDNATLAKRLKVGLDRALKDGSFDKLFNQFFTHTIEKATLDKRRIIKLHNPYADLPAELKDPKYWLLDHPDLH